jgi:peptidoglycan/xylan/chitin deacetylase (PgdA/CDA1 family)
VKADADKSSSSQGAAGNEKCKEAGSFETVPTEENTCVKYEGKCYTCNIWAPNNDGYWCGQEDGWFFKTTGLADNIGKSQEATWYTEVDCNGEAPKPSSSSAGEPNEPGDPGDLTTKAGIQAYIDENWQKVGGYSSKPTKVIALSYDDGPCGQTQALLNVLKEKNVKTTFFVIGQNIGSQQSAMRNMYADGHEIANHSNGYDSGPSQSSIQSCSDAIKNITGSNPTLFRAPNFSYSQGLTQSCTNLGLPIIHAECTSGDYNQGQTGSQTISAVTNCAKDGAIVNLHEGNTAPNTVGATGQLIDQLRADGYWIMPVGQMAIYKGVKLNAGSQYQKF